MSTILTALKKAQDNADLAREQGAEIKAPTPVFKRTVAPTPRRRSKPPAVAALALCGCLAAMIALGGWFYWMTHPSAGLPLGRQPEAMDMTAKKTAAAPSLDTKKTTPEKKPAFIPPSLEMTQKDPGPVLPPQPQPLKPLESQRPLPKPEPAVADKHPVKPVPETKNVPVPDQAPQKTLYPMADSSLLDLQAISWSKDPSQRIAVINDKILGEKERVQGHLILHIEPDQVVLKDPDGRPVGLPFKYQ